MAKFLAFVKPLLLSLYPEIGIMSYGITNCLICQDFFELISLFIKIVEKLTRSIAQNIMPIMPNNLPPIYFYLPQADWREDIPEQAGVYWKEFGRNMYCWTLQTYLYLKASDFPCILTGSMPTEGILLGHRDSFPYNFKPSSKLLIICIKSDQNPHPYAHIHIVQNAQEVQAQSIHIQSVTEDRYLLPGKRFYLPLWPQPGLIPRDNARGDKFENVGYFGISYNLAPELRKPEWKQQLESIGLNWYCEKQENRWQDYSQVDVIVAARSFNEKCDYPWKPASKLYNAWHAGVPAILTPESAFRGERKSELDYLEVNSLNELIEALKRLRDDPNLRRAMVENGKIRAQETQPENLVKRWSQFLTDICIPAYEEWRAASRWDRQRFFLGRYSAIQSIKVLKRLSR